MDTSTLGHYLKIWADRYKATGETKGGTINLMYDTLVITSNYSIEELFKDEAKMIEPLKRRFEEIYAYAGYFNGKKWNE